MAQIWMQILFKVAQFWMPFNTQAFLARQGFVSVGNTPEQFTRDLSAEALEWETVVKKAGARLDE